MEGNFPFEKDELLLKPKEEVYQPIIPDTFDLPSFFEEEYDSQILEAASTYPVDHF
jgi:hypothetical protein